MQLAIWLLLAGFLWIPYWYLVSSKYEGSFASKLHDLSLPAKAGYVLLTLMVLYSFRNRPEASQSNEAQTYSSQSELSAVPDAPDAYGVSKSEINRLFGLLVDQVAPGMTTQQVTSILGTPHHVQKGGPVPQLANFEIWQWRCEDDDTSGFSLGFNNGILENGGSAGYDIRSGFKTKLPSNATSSERERLRETATLLGIEVEE